MKSMDEHNTQKRIHQAVLDSLSWLDELPSQESEILAKTKKEAESLITVYNGITETTVQPVSVPAVSRSRALLRPALILTAMLILAAGFLGLRSNGFIQSTPLDAVTQPAGSDETPGTPGLPAAMDARENLQSQTLPLDRIDLQVEPDLLWNSETGILTEGENVIKNNLPF